jgi:glyoxylase-like metal-dependent hydrolase (beta-lactamase superfamily II)
MQVFAIDTEYVRPRMDASHLLIAAGRAAFVDTGTHFSVPILLSALAEHGLAGEAVDYIFLTHIHLDHAGGVGGLAAALPCAAVVVHPRGTAHLMNPGKLIAATKAVYGESAFARLYGELVPVPASRLIAAEDGQSFLLGGESLEFIHTPGHALHHACLVDRAAGAVFTGDTFGISYRELDTPAGEFIFPTTTPTQFDPAQLHASIDRVLALQPRWIYLTHYGPIGATPRLGDELHADIDAFVAIARTAAGEPDREAAIARGLWTHLSRRLDAHGYGGGEAQRHAVLDADVRLNAAGLHAWLARVA